MKETESRICKYSRDDPDAGMKLQNKLKLKCEKFKERLPFWFEQFTGHRASNFATFHNFVNWMHVPVDAASLGIFRILFGITMLIDIPEERGGGNLDIRFGEPKHCHFPLFDFVRPLGLPQMGIVYLIMWLGALGMALGYKFKISCLMFIVPYWYVFLLDKPAWNNHSYLYGLCGLLFLMTNANRFGSLDNWGATREQQMVPFWNYFIIKFQFFILYFVAGLKKLTTEWLSGYSMINLGYHWVFAPFRTVLSVEMIELLIIHWFIAIFDVSIAFWMTYEKTRLLALPFMISFHLMNSRLFTIGMFPWVCLAELPLFFPLSCPRNIWKKLTSQSDDDSSLKENVENFPPVKDQMPCEEKCNLNPKQEVRKRKKDKLQSIGKSIGKQVTTGGESSQAGKIPIINKLRIVIIFVYCFLQFFLPYSHFITKGYNNWTNGIYGYSWDMMVHSYDTILTSIKIVDNKNGKAHYLEPYAFSEYDRWTKHADMAIQYAKCIQKNILEDYDNNPQTMLTSRNISIYIDVWCSMNNRFQQRVFDPRVDLLKAKWSPFEKTKWVLPVLNELNHMRPKLNAIASDVLAWSNHSDVMFIADFAGLTMENFISSDLDNVTLTVLQGAVHYRSENEDDKGQSISSGQSLLVTPGEFHQVTTISLKPSCYMYTYVNKTMQDLNISVSSPEYNQPMLPLWSEFKERLSNYKNFLYHIGNSIMFLAYGVPMPVRIRERE